MGVVTWIVLGALAGLAWSIFAGNNNTGFNTAVGIAGACLGGGLAVRFGIGSAVTFNLINAGAAVITSVLLLLIFSAITRRLWA